MKNLALAIVLVMVPFLSFASNDNTSEEFAEGKSFTKSELLATKTYYYAKVVKRNIVGHDEAIYTHIVESTVGEYLNNKEMFLHNLENSLIKAYPKNIFDVTYESISTPFSSYSSAAESLRLEVLESYAVKKMINF